MRAGKCPNLDMVRGQMINGAEQSGEDRADDGADESTPSRGPKRGPIQRPGSGSPGGMYGPHVGSAEIMDLMAELAQSHPDARLHLDVMGADGVKRAGRTYSVTSFDFDNVVAQYGGGEYRVRVQQLGEPKPVRMFRFIAATQSNPTPPIPPQTPPAAPAPQYAPPPPYYPQQVQGYPYPPPQAPQADGLMAMMMNMAVESAKSQALMMNTLLAKLIEQRTTPQEPAKITELEAMIKLADKLGNRRGGGGRDDGGGGGEADMLASIAGALKNILPPAAPTPAAAPPRRKLVKLPPKLIPTKHAGSAALPGVAPQAVPQPASDRPPLAEDGDSHAAPSSDGATPPAGQAHQASTPAAAADATPLDPMTAAFVQGMRTNPDARRLAKLILVDDGDDAEALGVMAAALLDDDQAEAMRAATPGQWTRLFVLAFPALDKAKKVELVGAVESAIRDQLAEDDAGDDQGDAGDDAQDDQGADDDDDTSDEEGTDRA